MRSQDGLHCETNSLSLRERARVRGKAVCNGQGLGALPGVELCFPSLRAVEVTGSSQARGFAERFFPLTPASPRGEGEPYAALSPIRSASTRRPRDMRCSPPCGKGRGRTGKYGSLSSNVFKAFPLSPALSPARSSRGEGEEEAPRAPLAFVACLATPLWNAVIPILSAGVQPGGLASQTAGLRRGGNW